VSQPAGSSDEVIVKLGAAREIEYLRRRLAEWLSRVDPELRSSLSAAFAGTPKSFRPLTLFACHRAVHGTPPPPPAVDLALAVELAHNMSLIIDDMLDESDLRRGTPTVHSRFGPLVGMMTSGYLVADAFEAVAEDSFAVRNLSQLLRRLAAAECLQWRVRRRPLGPQDWRRIAGEDTGSMFEMCAVLGARSERLRRYGHLLGVLYHGCDDVADQRGVQALGGGGDEDIRDGILTLPVALAIRDPRIRAIFLVDDEDQRRLATLAEACAIQLEASERVLDTIAEEARAEATVSANHPEPLLALVEQVRQLSRR
jgi:geranylgeranyl pyrophosphate synthase